MEDIKYFKSGDRLFFNVNGESIEYLVNIRHLVETNGLQNDKIFKVLNLNKVEFCDKHYGYPSSNNGSSYWPECINGDYEALSRVIHHLYKEIEKREKGSQIVELYEIC